MEFVIPTTEELGYGLRALKTIALADGDLHEAERNVLAAAQSVFGDARPLDSFDPITPAEPARGIASPAVRRQLFGGMIVTCMADGEIGREARDTRPGRSTTGSCSCCRSSRSACRWRPACDRSPCSSTPAG